MTFTLEQNATSVATNNNPVKTLEQLIREASNADTQEADAVDGQQVGNVQQQTSELEQQAQSLGFEETIVAELTNILNQWIKSGRLNDFIPMFMSTNDVYVLLKSHELSTVIDRVDVPFEDRFNVLLRELKQLYFYLLVREGLVKDFFEFRLPSLPFDSVEKYVKNYGSSFQLTERHTASVLAGSKILDHNSSLRDDDLEWYLGQEWVFQLLLQQHMTKPDELRRIDKDEDPNNTFVLLTEHLKMMNHPVFQMLGKKLEEFYSKKGLREQKVLEGLTNGNNVVRVNGVPVSIEKLPALTEG